MRVGAGRVVSDRLALQSHGTIAALDQPRGGLVAVEGERGHEAVQGMRATIRKLKQRVEDASFTLLDRHWKGDLYVCGPADRGEAAVPHGLGQRR